MNSYEHNLSIQMEDHFFPVCDACHGTGILYEVFGDGEVVKDGCPRCQEDEQAARARMTAEEVAADRAFAEEKRCD